MNPIIGARAAWCNIAVSSAAFAVGIAIMFKGGSAGADAIVAGPTLLLMAECLKLSIGVCLFLEVKALAGVAGHRLPQYLGIVAAALIVVAGAIGIGALLAHPLRDLGRYVNPLAAGSLAASGMWALTTVLSGRSRRLFPTWAAIAGILVAVPSVFVLVFPPAGLGAFVIGLIWHAAVGRRLGKGASHKPGAELGAKS